MFFATLLVALMVPSQQQPPRDPMVSPGIVLDAPAREAEVPRIPPHFFPHRGHAHNRDAETKSLIDEPG